MTTEIIKETIEEAGLTNNNQDQPLTFSSEQEGLDFIRQGLGIANQQANQTTQEESTGEQEKPQEVDPIASALGQKIEESQNTQEEVQADSDSQENNIPEKNQDVISNDFKALKQKHKEEVSQYKQRIAELEENKTQIDIELKKENERLKQEIENAKAEKEQAIELAEKNKQFAEVFNFQESEEYQEQYIKPATNVISQLYKYADDYGVPRAFIDGVVEEENIQIQNQTLLEKFDAVAVSQILPKIQNLKTILESKRQADAKPFESREELRQQIQRQKESERIEKENRFSKNTQDSWEEVSDAYKQYQYTKDYYAGENSVALSRDAKELYGQIVTGLKKAGGLDIDKNLTQVLAAATHKAVAFDTMVKDLLSFKEKNKELQSTLNSINARKSGVKTSSTTSDIGGSPNGATPNPLADKNSLLAMLEKASQERADDVF